MKRLFFVSVIIGILSMAAICFGQVKGNFNLGYRYNSDSMESLNIDLDAMVKVDRAVLQFSYALGKVQDDEKLSELDIDSKIQLNYYANRYFGFLGVEYERDFGIGIEDKTNTGIGIGYEVDYGGYADVSIQTGLYLCSEYTPIDFERFVINKTSANMVIPFADKLSLIEKACIETNMDNIYDEDYILSTLTAIRIDLTDRISASIGLDYQYVNRPVIGTKDRREWITSIGVKF